MLEGWQRQRVRVLLNKCRKGVFVVPGTSKWWFGRDGQRGPGCWITEGFASWRMAERASVLSCFAKEAAGAARLGREEPGLGKIPCTACAGYKRSIMLEAHWYRIASPRGKTTRPHLFILHTLPLIPSPLTASPTSTPSPPPKSATHTVPISPPHPHTSPSHSDSNSCTRSSTAPC